MRLISAHATHTGHKRHNNEDAYLDTPGLYAVADGMGGYAAGEVASKMAIDTIRNSNGLLDTRIQEAHRRLLDAMAEDRNYTRMGTTVTALGIREDAAEIAHAGDSRCYLVRGGVGSQLTSDHKEGRFISNCVGHTEDSLQFVSTFKMAVRRGDLFVMCTDGLSDYANAQIVAQIANRFSTPQALATELVKHALDSGGHDNVTVVIVAVR